ncbi:MAG: TatD family hydrolase [Desulfurococcales archaeon]|nr:TatD family hydrolase [Desulfurococcales archaeon]
MIPIADAHGHSNPARGLGAYRIAEKFRESGGWFWALVSLSPWSYGIDGVGMDAYKAVIDLHLRECKEAEDAGLRVACFAGFHPADVDRLIDRYRVEPSRVLRLGMDVIEYIAGLCRDGVLDGIGEVGRQHYKTGAERAVISELILEKALEYSRDYGCIVQMHLEHVGSVTVDLVDYAVNRLGVKDRRLIVFHHSKPVTGVHAHRLGYSVNIPGVPRLLSHVFKELEPFYMIESDFIDDPARPGAVVYPWEMAGEVARLRDKGVVDEEYIYKVNVDNIVKLYRVEPP